MKIHPIYYACVWNTKPPFLAGCGFSVSLRLPISEPSDIAEDNDCLIINIHPIGFNTVLQDMTFGMTATYMDDTVLSCTASIYGPPTAEVLQSMVADFLEQVIHWAEIAVDGPEMYFSACKDTPYRNSNVGSHDTFQYLFDGMDTMQELLRRLRAGERFIEAHMFKNEVNFVHEDEDPDLGEPEEGPNEDPEEPRG